MDPHIYICVQVFELFATSFDELHSIFSHYARAGTSGSGAAANSFVLQKSEMATLAHDIELPHKNFPMARVQVLSLYIYMCVYIHASSCRTRTS